MDKPPQNTFEQRKDELRNLIKLKKQSAIYDDQFDELFKQIENYEHLISNGGIDGLLDLEKEDYKKKKEKLESISLQVKTLPEFRFVLSEIGKSEEEIQENLAHENAHANVAESLGARHETYIVYFLKNGNVYQTRVTLPDSLTEDEVYNISKKAIEAPEEYGKAGGLSDDDKDQLKRL